MSEENQEPTSKGVKKNRNTVTLLYSFTSLLLFFVDVSIPLLTLFRY